MIQTDRLTLRSWRDADRGPYAAMMADPEVGDWLGGTLSESEANGQVDRFAAHTGPEPGFLAVEVTATGEFVGAACLRTVAGEGHPMAGAVEIGWRFKRSAWGFGYATEAARALVAEGFGRLGLAEIVAFTASTNRRSQAVMERLCFSRAAERDFEHPGLAQSHPLRPHVVYRLLRG